MVTHLVDVSIFIVIHRFQSIVIFIFVFFLDCIFSANNGTSSFYVNGCLIPVASVAFSQITGIAVINSCLTILAFVCSAKLINLFPEDSDTNKKQPRENEINQAQQQQPQQHQYPYTVNGEYSTNNYPRSPYLNNAPTYRTYL